MNEKDRIDKMFSIFEALADTIEKGPKEKDAAKNELLINKNPFRKLKLKDPEALTSEQETEAIFLADAEIEKIRDSFYEFTCTISETVVYSHIYDDVTNLAHAFDDIERVIHNTFDEEELSQKGKEYFESVQKIRLRILHHLLKRNSLE